MKNYVQNKIFAFDEGEGILKAFRFYGNHSPGFYGPVPKGSIVTPWAKDTDFFCAISTEKFTRDRTHFTNLWSLLVLLLFCTSFLSYQIILLSFVCSGLYLLLFRDIVSYLMLNDIEVNQVASQKIMQYGYWLIRFWKNVYYAVRRTT